MAVNNLAMLHDSMGDPERAESLYQQALAGCEKSLGKDHPLTLTTVSNLAELYMSNHDYVAAEPLLKRVFATREESLGANHPDTLVSAHNLAGLHRSTGDYAAAEQLYQRTLAGFQKALGADHPLTLKNVNSLAALYWRMNRLDQSIPLFEDLLKRQQAKLGDDHPDTLLTLANLGVNYRDAGRLEQAIPLLERAHESIRKYPTLAWVTGNLLDAYVMAGKPSEAVRLILKVLAGNRQCFTPGSPELGSLLAATGQDLLEVDPAAAEPVLRECLMLRETLDPQAWNTANARSLLGGALLLQKKCADAEPLLRAGYEGLKADEQDMPPPAKSNIPDAIQRLIDLYDATEKPDEATKWRKELEAARPATDK